MATTSAPPPVPRWGLILKTFSVRLRRMYTAASSGAGRKRLQPRGVITWGASKLETARADKPGGDCMSRLDLRRAPSVRVLLVVGASLGLVLSALPPEIGRASCRERGAIER